MNDAAAAQPKRSEMVTIFAWINIALCILGVLAGIALTLLFSVWDPSADMLEFFHRPEVQPAIPGYIEFMVRHLRGLFAVSVILSAVSLVASYALLKRKNWARLYWIGMMALVVVECLYGMFHQPDMTPLMIQLMGPVPPDVEEGMRQSAATGKIYGYVISLAQAGVFAWGIWYFLTDKIKREFAAEK